MSEVHRVETCYDDGQGRYYWECECGQGGNGPVAGDADVHSDKHIPADACRIDIHRPDRW